MEALNINSKKIDHDKVINYLLIGYALCLPISKAGVNIFETLILLTWIIQGNWKEKYTLYKSNLLIVSLMMFLLLNILSIPWASSFPFALEYIGKYRHFLVILPIYSSLDKKFIQYIFSSFLAGMFLSELVSYGIFFELIHYKNIPPTNPAPFMNHSDYSVFLSFASILLLSRLIDNTPLSIKRQVVYILFFITTTSNLFLNGGRTGQVTFIVIIFIKLIMCLDHKIKATLIAIFLIISVFLTAYVISPNFHARTNQTLQDINLMIYQDDFETGALGQRVSFWIIGLDDLKDNIFGHGIGNDVKNVRYYAEKRGYAASTTSSDTFTDHHNMFLTIALQLGLIGSFIIFSMFYAIFTLSFKSENYKILNLTFIVAFSMWSFGGMTFHLMNSMIFFALFAGLFNAISKIEKGEAK